MLSAPNAIPLAPNPLSPNSSAAPPPRKIFFPPSSPPSKPTPPSEKSPTPCAASSANTRNPSSSNVECGSLAPAFLLSPLRRTFFRTCTSLQQHLLKSPASSAGPRHRLSPRLRCSILSRINRWRPKFYSAPKILFGPAIIIAADTEVTLDGRIFGKPRSSDEARHMLEKLSGRTHSVVTGVALIRLPDVERRAFVESTLVHFAVLSPEEITRYLATGEPHDKAGAYGIQGRASRYIPRIEDCSFCFPPHDPITPKCFP